MISSLNIEWVEQSVVRGSTNFINMRLLCNLVMCYEWCYAVLRAGEIGEEWSGRNLRVGHVV